MPITQILLTAATEAAPPPPPPSPDGNYYQSGNQTPWESVGVGDNKPFYNSVYYFPDNVTTGATWDFNGINQFMTTQSIFNVSEIYLNLWFYPTASGRVVMSIFGQQDETLGYRHSALEINVNLTVSGGFWNGFGIQSMTTANTVTLNAWNHIYLRHNGTQALLQLNGGTAVTSTHSWNSPFLNNNLPLVIGFGNSPGSVISHSARYQGSIAEFRLDTANTASNYDATRTIYETPPLFIYDDFTVEWWQKAENPSANVQPFTIGLLPSTLELSLRYGGPASGHSGRDRLGINNGFALADQPLKNHYTGSWEHMAIVRKEGDVNVYSNGTAYLTLNKSNSTVNTAIDNLTAQLVIGTGGQAPPGVFNNYQGYIKDFHVIKGYAKYTSNFTPSVFPVYPQEGSVFLLPVVGSGNAYDDVIDYKSATLTNTPTFVGDTPYPGSIQIQVGPPLGIGNSLVAWFGEDRTTIDNAGVGGGWVITGDQGGSVTVTGIDYQHVYFAGQDWIPGSTVYTFTSPDPGGSLYFDLGDYINYGSSVDFAFDVDAIAQGSITLNIDANDPNSYSPASGSTWIDLSGTGNITLVGSPYYTAGAQSYLDFNGTSQYGTGSATDVIPQAAYTKMVWFKIDSFANDNNLVSSDGGGHFMYFNQTTTLYAGHSNVLPYNDFGSVATFNTNTWYCATVTFSVANGIRLYVNGILDAEDPSFQTPHNGTGSTNIACFGAGGNLLNGKIGRVLCYGRELAAEEVLQNFNATKNRYGL